MTASPLRESACASCGAELPAGAEACPACGSIVDDAPPLETAPTPVAHSRVERRWLGVPVRFVLLWLGFAGLGAAAGLLASGRRGWGLAALVVSTVLFGVLAEATRRGGGLLVERSTRLAADGRAQAASVTEVWRARLDTTRTRWRTTSRLRRIERERRSVLPVLGEAAWRRDAEAERRARRRLEALDEERRRLEDDLSRRVRGAEDRIRLARLPVQDTMMVTPNEPNAPYPPPGEGDPPQPAQVPEPYPPPDEGTPPTPAPDDD